MTGAFGRSDASVALNNFDGRNYGGTVDLSKQGVGFSGSLSELGAPDPNNPIAGNLNGLFYGPGSKTDSASGLGVPEAIGGQFHLENTPFSATDPLYSATGVFAAEYVGNN
ncbi:MAG: hypothetical protein R3C42_01150 [Parvularculaceae bacterium]